MVVEITYKEGAYTERVEGVESWTLRNRSFAMFVLQDGGTMALRLDNIDKIKVLESKDISAK